MGGKLSSSIEKNIGQNDFMNELCGAEPIKDHDAFWSKFAYSSLLGISQEIVAQSSAEGSVGKVASAVSSSSVLSVGDYFPLSLIHPQLLDKHLYKYASLLRRFYHCTNC